jgi:hypothetical protein
LQPGLDISALRAMAQGLIHQHEGQHGFGDGSGAGLGRIGSTSARGKRRGLGRSAAGLFADSYLSES